MRIIINYYEYKKLRENGATTHLHNIKSNPAETINYEGEIYSLDLFVREHGYGWIQYAGGQDWLYRSESGQELCVEIR